MGKKYDIFCYSTTAKMHFHGFKANIRNYFTSFVILLKNELLFIFAFPFYFSYGNKNGIFETEKCTFHPIAGSVEPRFDYDLIFFKVLLSEW